MTDKETPIADEAAVLKGDNEVIIKSGDGRVGKCDVIVNGVKSTFDTGKKITVSDAQLDVLRNSGRTVEELDTGKKGKGKGSSADEAGAGEGSLASAKGGKESAKTGAKAASKVVKEPASNVTAAGNTNTTESLKVGGEADKS